MLQETCVAAAALSPAALSGIEQHLIAGRREVRRRAHGVPALAARPGRGRHPRPSSSAGSGLLRLAFQNALSQFDLFSEVVTQRSEHDNGVLLSGLDVAAAEALLLPGRFFEWPAGRLRRCTAASAAPSAGRGPGCRAAATIRSRSIRIPAGAHDRVRHRVVAGPRGRAPGRGAARSGRVAARAARPPVRSARGRPPGTLWDRWISEIVADFWSISRIGIGSTLGLIGLVSLPRGFVFRPPDEDPHPIPWVRVLLSCAIGDRLYPDPQWAGWPRLWRAMYPIAGVRPELARD